MHRLDAGDKLLVFGAIGFLVTLCFSIGACSYLAGECIKSGKTWKGDKLCCEAERDTQ